MKLLFLLRRELQNKRLQNVQFLQEAKRFPVLLLDVMSVCEITLNLRGIKWFILLYSVIFFALYA